MESLMKKETQETEPLDIEAALQQEISGRLLGQYFDQEPTHTTDDGTHYLETNTLSLAYTVDEDELGILNIEAFEKDAGVGGELLDVLHQIAEDKSLQVRAYKVLDSAIDFWEQHGYELESEDEEGMTYAKN